MPWNRTSTTVIGRLLLALWAGLATCPGPAQGATEERSAATHAPRAAAAPAGPLARADVARYRDIFRLQAQGDLAAADRLIARLGNPLLLGHVLWQRYMHPTAHRSSYAELAAWLGLYADHPGADRIYRLALRRQPAGAAPPAPPVPGYLGGSGQGGSELVRVNYRSARTRSRIASAARTAARSFSASGTGAPNTAIMPSPLNSTTVPCASRTTSETVRVYALTASKIAAGVRGSAKVA